MDEQTRQEVAAATKIVLALAQAIQELGRVPSGHLYATVQHLMPLIAYTKVIGIIKASGMVREEGHELVWIGK